MFVVCKWYISYKNKRSWDFRHHIFLDLQSYVISEPQGRQGKKVQCTMNLKGQLRTPV